MSTKLVFLRRTEKEIEVFGGEVYIDINGKNIGILGTSDFVYEVIEGQYKVKMYKSHTYDSFIGSAEAEVCVEKGEDLLIKYSPPMLINQPGSIIVSEFKSYDQVENMALEKEQKIIIDDNEAKQKKYEQEKRSKNGVIIVTSIMVISAIIWCIYYFAIMFSLKKY